jgi:hypothetical protein
LDLDREEPLDPHVGSHIGASQEKARELGRGEREIARSDIPTAGGSGGHSRVSEWNTGVTKPRDLAARSPEVLVFGFASREVPRASRAWAHNITEEISAVHLKQTHGARLGSSPLRPSQLQSKNINSFHS